MGLSQFLGYQSPSMAGIFLRITGTQSKEVGPLPNNEQSQCIQTVRVRLILGKQSTVGTGRASATGAWAWRPYSAATVHSAPSPSSSVLLPQDHG